MLMLLDSASLYFRAFYGVPDTLRAADGTPVNAVRGLLDIMAFLINKRRPDRMVACWDDDWRPAWRVELIESYKAHRVANSVPGGPDIEETPELLDVQVPIIVDVLAALGIARVGCPGFEADDVIGTLTARERAGQAGPVEIVTGDRDLFQLVDDAAHVSVLYPARGIRNIETVDQAWIQAKYGLDNGRAYADMAVLRGDPSDGLPGVAGIGEKTAAALLNRYGTLDEVLATLNRVDPRLTTAQRRRLAEAAEYLQVAPTVVAVATNAPISPIADALPSAPVDPGAFADLANRWNLGGSARRILTAMAER